MTMTAQQALEALKAGNARFISAKAEHPHQDMARVKELAQGQHPFAIVLACADSRSTPEILFDQGLGDLFVVRVAGNVLDNAVIGSIEYAVAHLHVPLIVVLGHSKCGAINAVITDAELTPSLTKSLAGVCEVRKTLTEKSDDELKVTTIANAYSVAEGLKNMPPVLDGAFKDGKVKIISAFHELETGAVEFYE
jgi:carbonic anhydrase